MNDVSISSLPSRALCRNHLNNQDRVNLKVVLVYIQGWSQDSSKIGLVSRQGWFQDSISFKMEVVQYFT